MEVEPPHDVIDFFPLAAKTYGRGEHLFESISESSASADKELQKGNLYYPFSCKMDWQVAKWLLLSHQPIAAINAFFKLDYVSSNVCH